MKVLCALHYHATALELIPRWARLGPGGSDGRQQQVIQHRLQSRQRLPPYGELCAWSPWGTRSQRIKRRKEKWLSLYRCGWCW